MHTIRTKLLRTQQTIKGKKKRLGIMATLQGTPDEQLAYLNEIENIVNERKRQKWQQKQTKLQKQAKS